MAICAGPTRTLNVMRVPFSLVAVSTVARYVGSAQVRVRRDAGSMDLGTNTRPHRDQLAVDVPVQHHGAGSERGARPRAAWAWGTCDPFRRQYRGTGAVRSGGCRDLRTDPGGAARPGGGDGGSDDQFPPAGDDAASARDGLTASGGTAAVHRGGADHRGYNNTAGSARNRDLRAISLNRENVSCPTTTPCFMRAWVPT